MAIKISGDTIIDDSRVIVNADKIGIGTTNPHVALEIFSGDVGIGTTNPNSPVLSSNTSKLAVGIITANTFFGNLVGGISDTGDVTVTGNLTVEGNTTLGDAVGDTLTINATPTFEEDTEFKKSVSIGGTLTYEDVTNVDSIGIVTAGKGLRVTQGGIQVNAGITTLMGNVGIGTSNPDDPVTSSNTNKLAVGIVTAHEFRGGTFYGTIDSDVSTISLNANLEDVFSVSGNELSADDAGADKIVFWDDDGGSGSAGELTYLAIDSTTLEIDNSNTLKVKSGAVGKDYDLDFEGTTGGNGVGIVTWTLTDDVNPPNKDPVTLKAGSNISISNVGATDFTIAAVDGAGVGIAASASQILNVNSGNIGGVNPGVTSDRIVYWNEDGISGGRLDYLDIGNGLEIISDQLRVDSSVVGKSYELPVTVENGTTGNGGNSGIATVILRDTTNSIDDPVTIKAGSGIVIDSVTDGFKISADISGGGGGGISTVDVIQYSDNADPRTVRSAANPIDVQETVGIVTIGIGTTSNAYGNRFIGPIQPSSAVNGDIWYDTSTMGEGTTRVAVVKDQKNTGVNGGSFVNNGWRDRDLTVKDDPFNFVTLYTNASYQTTPGTGGRASYFSLPAGKYKIRFSAPAWKVNRHMAAIGWSPTESNINKTYASGDFTGGEIYGSSQFAQENYGRSTNNSKGSGIVEITQTSYFKVIHYASLTQNNQGFGYPANIPGSADPETYTIVEIEDLATAVKDGAFGDKIEEGNTKAEVVDTGTNGHFLVETENTERLRITGIGSVGIGTTDPATKLDVFGDIKLSESNPEIQFNTGGPRFRVPADNTLSIHSGGDSGSESLERIRITGIGSVGIGTTNPLVKFRVIQGAGSGYNGSFNARTAAVFENYNTDGTTISILGKSSGYSGIFFGDESNEASGQIQYRHSDESFTFLTNYANPNRNALFISGDNNVGIGTSVFDTPVLSSNTSILAVGIVTANKYYGDGSNLTGITAGGGGGSVATSIQTFTTAGNFTYTPTSGTTSIVVHVIGAGGESGTPRNSAFTGGGGAGGVAIKTYSATEVGATAAIVVGNCPVVNNFPNQANGVNGLDSSFTPSGTGIGCTGGGGKGSSSSNNPSNPSDGGNGGTGSGGDINLTGDKGHRVISPNQSGVFILHNWAYLPNNNVFRYHTHRAKAAGGGYGQYGLGGEAAYTSDNSSWNNGRGGSTGAVIIYEYAGSGGSGGGSSFVLLSEKPSTSGTEVEFTGIPSDAMEITVMFKGVSGDWASEFNVLNHFKVELGTSSGYITSGYVSNSTTSESGSGVHGHVTESFTNSFGIYVGSSSNEVHGSMIINKASSTSYTEIGDFRRNNDDGSISRGSLSSVSGTIDRLRVRITNARSFDAGTISVSYKTSSSGGGSGSGGSGSGNYESYISSFSGNDNIEFTNIPSWATKITLLGENVLLPEPSGNTVSIGSLLEFGGSSGYLGQNAFMNITSFITKSTTGSTTYGISEYNNTPYAPYILLNNSNVGTGPILSQIHFTFEKVKNENKWVYSGSVANRKGDPSTTTEDLKFLNEFTGSFTATEAITKLKLSSFQANVFPAINYTGGTLTAIYEGEGGGGSGSGSSFVLLSEKPSTSGTEVVFDNIPADALEITLMFTGVSASGNNNFKIQLGTANGYITSGYDSLSQNEGGGDDVPATDCFLIKTGSSSGGGQYRTGSMVIKKASSTSYVQTGQFVNTPQTEQGGTQTYGSLSSVSGTVDRLKIILSGSDTFDAGAMSVSYKTSGSGGGGASSSPLSFRNLVHNGEMRIAQRIAYVSGGAVTSTMGYHIDRWKAQSQYTDVTVTQARFSSTSTDIVYQLGFAHFFRFALSAAGTANASAYLEVYQVIEGQNIISSGWDYKSSSSYITLSFWFRASTNQTFYCYLKTYDGTTYMYPFSFTASGNDTWTKITKTIPGNSNLTINTYFARGLQIVIVPFYGTTYTNNQTLNNWTTYDFNNRFPDMASTWLTAGASTFDLTGVQLEVGETATPFEHRTYQDDLAICRRYFLNTASGSFIFPQNNVYTSMRFPQQMRIAPTLTLTGTGTPGGILATIDGFRAYNSLGPQDFAVMANAELT